MTAIDFRHSYSFNKDAENLIVILPNVWYNKTISKWEGLDFMEYSNLFVCLMGMGTVFVGLVCIVVLVIGMSAICRKLGHIEEAITPRRSPCRCRTRRSPACRQSGRTDGRHRRRHRRGYGHRRFRYPHCFY